MLKSLALDFYCCGQKCRNMDHVFLLHHQTKLYFIKTEFLLSFICELTDVGSYSRVSSRTQKVMVSHDKHFEQHNKDSMYQTLSVDLCPKFELLSTWPELMPTEPSQAQPEVKIWVYLTVG